MPPTFRATADSLRDEFRQDREREQERLRVFDAKWTKIKAAYKESRSQPARKAAATCKARKSNCT